jgi:hypothetical protein
VLKDGKVVCTFSGRRNGAGTFTASSGVFIYDPVANSWSDVSHPDMHYWTKDLVIDPNDTTQNTWYAGVFSGWGGAPNGLGGLFKTSNRGLNWTKLTGTQFDRVTSLTFNPQNLNQAFLTTETQGLWMSNNMNAATPIWSLVDSYPFRQPERVYFNPTNQNEMWVSSFGNGMKVGLINGGSGMADFQKSNAVITVFPNPVKDQLLVEINESMQGQKLIIRDIKGEVIHMQQVPSAAKQIDIDTKNWARGTYLIQCNQLNTKVVKY